MLAFGWICLFSAMALAALAFAGYTGAYAYAAKVVAAAFLALSVVAFASGKRAHCES